MHFGWIFLFIKDKKLIRNRKSIQNINKYKTITYKTVNKRKKRYKIIK